MSQILTGVDDTSIEQSANDMLLAKEVAEQLNRHYSGHLWAVTVDGKSKRLEIRNLLFSGNWGYVIHLTGMYSISDLLQRAKMAAGEILERYRVSRGRFDEEHYSTMSTDFAGRFAFDK